MGFYDDWDRQVLAAATQAQQAGEIPDAPKPQQFVFEIDALILMGHASYTMFADPALLERSRRGLERLLGPRPG